MAIIDINETIQIIPVDSMKVVLYLSAAHNLGLLLKWGCSSVGRALRSQCRGQRFDPAQLHYPPCGGFFIGEEAHRVLTRDSLSLCK